MVIKQNKDSTKLKKYENCIITNILLIGTV